MPLGDLIWHNWWQGSNQSHLMEYVSDTLYVMWSARNVQIHMINLFFKPTGIESQLRDIKIIN